jgi:hypothetical protein
LQRRRARHAAGANPKNLKTEEKKIVQHKTRALLIIAAALGAIVLAGFVGVSVKDDDFVPYRPNGKANHHPLHPNS